MRKPLIGITVESKHDPEDVRTRGKIELNWNYAQAIAEAGGVPLVVPPMADMDVVAELIDGWLIPGGADIDAAHFGEPNHPAVELQDPSRYEGESALFQRADSAMPVLGICYGCQFLNVVRGGALVQHLPDVVGHGEHSGGTMQTYAVEGDSKLAELIGGDRIDGKSYHHQAVGRLAQGLRVVAKGEDGTIEAIEAQDRPWMIGLQWHPERTLEDPATRAVFTEFVRAASEYAAKRIRPHG